MSPSRIPPETATIGIGTIQALLSEKGAERPSPFETAARIFLATLIGKYEPPEELVADATEEEASKYRWGHLALDAYKRRAFYEDTATAKTAKKVYDGRRSAYIKKLVKEGLTKDNARTEAWQLFPSWDSLEYSDSSTSSSLSASPVTAPPQNAPKAPIEAPGRVPTPSAVDCTPPPGMPPDPLLEREAATMSESARARLTREDALRARWNQRFPNATVFRDYLIANMQTRLRADAMKTIKEDFNASVEMLSRLKDCDWTSSKTGKVFKDLYNVIPWLYEDYAQGRTKQKVLAHRSAQLAKEAEAEAYEAMDPEDIETIRARRAEQAEIDEIAWRKARGLP